MSAATSSTGTNGSDGASPPKDAGPPALRPASRHGGGVVNHLERTLERGLDFAWARFTHRPVAGAVLAAGAGLTVATLFGATELALAAGIGYAAYQVLKRRVPPGQAIKEAMRIEKQLAE